MNKTYTKNKGVVTKTTASIPLVPCTKDHWSNVSDSITYTYSNLGFSQWLCPPIGQVLPLQGKYTSDIFKFAQIVIS